jgi:N-acyl-D-amino-acid deacylase
MSRLSENTGRPVLYQKLEHTLRKPEEWKHHMELIEDAMAHGIRAFPSTTPQIPEGAPSFTMHNCQMFRGVPFWHEVQMSKDAAVKMKAFADPEFRKAVHHELVDWPHDVKGSQSLTRNWPDLLCIKKAKLEKNRKYEDMTIRELAAATGKGIIDALLDLVIEEDLDTSFLLQVGRGMDTEIMSKILNYPHAIIGLSDAGAHVQFRAGYGYTSVMLGHWVRKHKIMSLEAAVKKLTFDVAQFFGIYDRGLVQPGMAADIVIFDPDTIRSVHEGKVSDLPGGAWRMKETAEGVMCTIVNGQVLIEEGQHTGALPGHIVRNSRYRERKEASNMQGKAVAAA